MASILGGGIFEVEDLGWQLCYKVELLRVQDPAAGSQAG